MRDCALVLNVFFLKKQINGRAKYKITRIFIDSINMGVRELGTSKRVKRKPRTKKIYAAGVQGFLNHVELPVQ